MQREISNNVQLGENLNPLKDLPKVPVVDNRFDLKDLFRNVDKLSNLWEDGKVDYSLIRYLTGLAKIHININILIHILIFLIINILIHINILLASNTYTSYSSLMIVLPIQIKKATDASADIDATRITVNNVFAHWPKEVDIKRYPDDIHILPTNNTVDIYRYSEKMLKYLPAKALHTIKETLLYDKTKVIIPKG